MSICAICYFTQYLVKWDFDNKTQESKGHGVLQFPFHVEKIALPELQSSGNKNPGNQHKNDTVKKFIPAAPVGTIFQSEDSKCKWLS